MNVGACYPKLMKEFMVKNDDIPHGLLNFSCKLFVRKNVSDIVIYICALVFNEEIPDLFHLNLLLLLLQVSVSFVAL